MRRQISLVALLIAGLALAACSNPTAPQQPKDCAVYGGSHTC